MDRQANLISSDADIHQLLQGIHRVAVLGIRSEHFPHMPASYVPAALIDAGLEIVPVPVYEKKATHMLGLPVYRRLVDIPGPIDLVDVFRRPVDIPGHVDDILAKKPSAVWFQLGIRHEEVAEALARNGIKVVQDRCLMVEYRRFLRDQAASGTLPG